MHTKKCLTANIFSSLQQKFLGRHITALLNMNGLKYEHNSMYMKMNQTSLENTKSLPFADKIDTGLSILGKHLTITQLVQTVFSYSSCP